MRNNPTSGSNLPLSANVSPGEIDAGLRQFMLGVYNYMASGLALTGVVAYMAAGSGLYASLVKIPVLFWAIVLAPHFRPEKFPIDTVIFTGGMPLEEFQRDRPREYQELVESGQLEQSLMPEPTPQSARFWRRLGFTALGVGLVMIGLIVYAMLFAYR